MEILDQNFLLGIVFLISLCIGSFMNVVIYRVVKGESVSNGRSYCPSCKNQLKWYHNIPIFSWIFLRGKCGFCKEHISIQYPIVELLVSIIGVLAYLNSGLTIYSIAIFLTFTTLLSISIIDLKYKLVPDNLSFIAISFAILHNPNIINSLHFAIIMVGFFAILRIMGEMIFKKEIMGEGDLMIAGIIGAMLPSFTQSMTALMVTSSIAILPSLYSKYKGNRTETTIDSRFENIEYIVNEMSLIDKEDVIFQQKVSLFKEGVENMKYKVNGDIGIPFIPFLFIGLFITYFFNINFY